MKRRKEEAQADCLVSGVIGLVPTWGDGDKDDVVAQNE